MFVEAPMQNIEYLKYPFKFENPEGGGGAVDQKIKHCVALLH